ncbi:hypothetical protein M513_02750 [Trichuris suis]|uniref:phospholipase A2 n=1 Tax=Trichuris suis TaxID=68888 RepID=A0A085MGE9_9BILA|nr:hypothetical protein M513_02750 [Trichuris suis]
MLKLFLELQQGSHLRHMFSYFLGGRKRIYDITTSYKKEYEVACSFENAGLAIVLQFPRKQTLTVGVWADSSRSKLYHFSEASELSVAEVLVGKFNDVCRMVHCCRGLGCTFCCRVDPVNSELADKELDLASLADYMSRYPGWLPIHYLLAVGFPFLCNFKGFPTIDHASLIERLFRVNVDVEKSKKRNVTKNEPDPFPRCFFDNFPEYVSIQDPETRQTLFHDLSNLQQLPALLNHAIDSHILQSRNCQNESPLQFYLINQDNVSPIVQLISHGAEVNDHTIVDKIPLHIAVEKCHVEFVKALLVFGADVDEAFVADCAVRHNPPSDRMRKVLDCLKLYCSQTIQVEESTGAVTLSAEPYADIHEHVRGKWIDRYLVSLEKQDIEFNNLIAFDGGGMAGVVLVQTLLVIQEHCGCDWFRCFDWVAGTSFGAVLAILLCQGYSLRSIQRLVFRLKDEIFLFKDAEIAGDALKQTLIRELGNESMASINEPRLVITTCDASARPAKLKLFRNYRPPISEHECELLGYEHPNELSLWKAAVCSTAVPGKFAPIDQKFVDGGLISNNPTQDLLTEFFRMKSIVTARHSHHKENIGCVVSVGAGISPRQISCAPRFNAALSLTGIIANLGQLVSLFELLRSQVTTTDDYVLDRCRACMYIFVENRKAPGTYVNQFIRSISWINFAENRNQGYLATGVYAGIIGITDTSLEPRESPFSRLLASDRRVNVNIRVHKAPISCVEWNTHFGYLCTSDDAGFVFLWKQVENGRWTGQLLCSTDNKVVQIRWNSSGQLGVLVTVEGFALVYSVTGEHRWTTSNPNLSVVSAAFIPTTNAEKQQLLLACSSGCFIVVDCNHFTTELIDFNFLGPICFMDYSASCVNENAARVAIATRTKALLFLRNIEMRKGIIHRGVGTVTEMRWSPDGYLLAVISISAQSSSSYLQIYRCDGAKCFERSVNAVRFHNGFTAIAWGYVNECLFFAQGRRLFTLRLMKHLPSLQMLASKQVTELCNHSSEVLHSTNLPEPAKRIAEESAHCVVQCLYPKENSLLQFVCRPVARRFYGTMVPFGPIRLPIGWELLMEHAGGQIPLLRAYRLGRFRPEYLIWLTDYSMRRTYLSHLLFGAGRARGSFPYCMARRRRRRNLARYKHFKIQKVALLSANFWCTHFSVKGLQPSALPKRLADINYSPNIFHAQPRQLTVKLVSPDYSAQQPDHKSYINSEAETCLEEKVCDALMAQLENVKRILNECFSAFRIQQNGDQTSEVFQPQESNRFVVDEHGSGLRETMQLECSTEGPEVSGATWWEKQLEDIAYIDEDDEANSSSPTVEKKSLHAVSHSSERPSSCPCATDTEFSGDLNCPGPVTRYLLQTEKLVNDFQKTLSFCHSNYSSQSAQSSSSTQLSEVTKSSVSANRNASAKLLPLCRLVRCWKQEIRQLKNVDTGAESFRRLGLTELYLINSQVDVAARFLECVDTHLCRYCQLCQGGMSDTECGNVLVLNNTHPLWNRELEVFQLDFGGRVTLQSAKNFQINYNDKQAGRIVQLSLLFLHVLIAIFLFRFFSSVGSVAHPMCWISKRLSPLSKLSLWH